MTKRNRSPRILLGAKCRAIKITEDGRTLVCWKSPEHVNSKYTDRRKHHDPSAHERWTD